MHWKSCCEHRHTGAGKDIVMISSREHAWCIMIRAGDWWNRTQVVRQNVSSYNIIIIIKPEIWCKIWWKHIRQNLQRIYRWHLLLLLLLILPRCLDMWTSIPAHIYPHLSKVRLLLETNGDINEQCLQWVPYIPGTMVESVPLQVYGTGHKAYTRVYALFKMVPRRREPALPSVTWRPFGRTGSFSCIT